MFVKEVVNFVLEISVTNQYIFPQFFSFSCVSQSNLKNLLESFSQIFALIQQKTCFFVLIDRVSSIFGAVTKLHVTLFENG